MSRAITVAALTVALLAPTHAHGVLLPGEPAAAPPAPDVPERPTVRVSRGQSLSAIADRHDVPGGWRRLAYVNRAKVMPNPDLIEVGTRLTIPLRDGKKVAWTPPPPPPPPTASSPSRSSAASHSSSSGSSTSSVAGSVWHRLAQCESGGNWAIDTGNGYYGGLQFSLTSWRWVGGSGYPHHASVATQIAMGERLKARQGWGAWPACSAKLGLR